MTVEVFIKRQLVSFSTIVTVCVTLYNLYFENGVLHTGANKETNSLYYDTLVAMHEIVPELFDEFSIYGNDGKFLHCTIKHKVKLCGD